MDTISPDRRSENMRRIGSKGMKLELVVRSLVHAMGYRYRLHVKDLPGKPDLVFPIRQKAIFVHGCFWHQHPSTRCKISRRPQSNLEYWIPKLERNRQRDVSCRAELRRKGWKVLVIWECQTRDRALLSHRIRAFLGARARKN